MMLIETVVLAWSLGAGAHSADFEGVPDRRWPGASWYVNRVQDWVVQGERLQCVDGRLPVRTANLLAWRLNPKETNDRCMLSTSVEPVGSPPKPGAFAGFLIGAGNESIDYRLSALVQQVPAPDGGLLAVVDGEGRARLLDFSAERTGGFSWTLPRNASLNTIPSLAEGTPEQPLAAPNLRLTIEPASGLFNVQLEVLHNGRVTSTASIEGVDRSMIDGGVGLVSHRETKQRGVGWSFTGLRAESADLDAWVDAHPERAWGPVLAVLYTIDRAEAAHYLNLTALFPPTEFDQLGEVALETEDDDGGWVVLATSNIEADSYTVPFRELPIDEFLGRSYRVRGEYDGEGFEWTGLLRAKPPADRDMVVGHLNCVKNVTAHKAWNRTGVWFPHEDVVAGVLAHDPDLVYCAGDQIYEGDLSGVDSSNILLDYHTKYQRWLWAFGEVARDRPTIVVPDDHDVFHGNIWGAGGVRAEARDGLRAQDVGGYKLSAELVNAIHRTQVGNLPAPTVPGPIGQGIDPYTTRLRWGAVDAAILADRMWKDSATILVPEAKVRNGWFKNLEFDPRDADVEGAEFLGLTQELFLEEWAFDRDPGASRKLVLSQTPWVNVATLPKGKDDNVIPSLTIFKRGGYAADDHPAADTDSGGWPQSPRGYAIELMRDADAIHLTGDQHLASLVQYGLDEFRDGPFVFTGPAVANTWPRRWMPKEEGGNRAENMPRYTGDFFDGFGNRMTVLAIANPEDRGRVPRRLFDLSPGYGIIRINPTTGETVLEAWPRWSDPTDPSQQFEGWPFTVAAPASP